MRHANTPLTLIRPLAALLALVVAGCASAPAPQLEPAVAPAPVSLEEQWGVQVVGIRMSAAGQMLDFRYRVVDPVKAAPLFVRKTKPYLIDLKSGASLVVPVPAKTGPLRSSNTPLAGRTYFMFFGNAGKLVQPGNRVTVVVGDFRAENLTVQ